MSTRRRLSLLQKIIRFTVILLAALLIGIILTVFAGFCMSIMPHRVSPLAAHSHKGMPYESIRIKTSDNIMLSAWWIHNTNQRVSSRSIIVLLHGYHSSKEDLLHVAKFLYPTFDVFMFDFRAHGESSGKFTTLGAREVTDAVTAVNFLHQKGYKNIGLFGFSMGGAVALQLCGNKHVKAIVADSPYASLGDMVQSRYRSIPVFQTAAVWLTKQLSKIFFHINTDRISPAQTLLYCSLPVFVMHARGDPLIPVSHAFQIKDALKTNKNAKVWIVDAQGHGTLHAILGKRYETQILRFLIQTK